MSAVAPGMGAHCVPAAEQCCHCSPNASGAVPRQVPRSPRRTEPSRGTPVTLGPGASGAGGEPTVGRVGADSAEALPPAFVPVTRARSR